MRYALVDVKYLLFSELYTRLEEPKSKRKAFGILEAAIGCYAKKGFDAVTMEMIARQAGVTRTLLLHYFEDGAEIRELSVKYIRLLFQKLAVEAMTGAKTPDEMLSKYIDACFYWTANFRSHSLVWLLFLHRCAGDHNLRDLNTLAVTTGADRIVAILEKGREYNIFDFSDARAVAKAIQTIITGALVVGASENLHDHTEFARTTREQCMRLAGVKSA